MRLVLTRDVFGGEWTLGRLDIEYDSALEYSSRGWVARRGETRPLPFGYVCEDQDRGLDAAMPLTEISRVKVSAETAIPTGSYRVVRTYSPKYRKAMMLVFGVPGFSGIRIHPGNNEADSAGCLLPGLSRNERAGTVLQSTTACAWLDARVQECELRGELVSIRIQRDAAAWAGRV